MEPHHSHHAHYCRSNRYSYLVLFINRGSVNLQSTRVYMCSAGGRANSAIKCILLFAKYAKARNQCQKEMLLIIEHLELTNRLGRGIEVYLYMLAPCFTIQTVN